VELIRPSLPGSALQALVQEAKVNDRRPSVDYGDSTINSLEDLITPLPESTDGENEEDTLQGLQLPTSTPRNDAERRRQQEAQQLHRMNNRLRAARTSIRQASRGMQRVEEQVEHVEADADGVQVRVIHHAYPYEFSMWTWFKSCFWYEPLKIARQEASSWWKICGGLTALSITMIIVFTWLTSEIIAWYVSTLWLAQICYIKGHNLIKIGSKLTKFSVNIIVTRYMQNFRLTLGALIRTPRSSPMYYQPSRIVHSSRHGGYHYIRLSHG